MHHITVLKISWTTDLVSTSPWRTSGSLQRKPGSMLSKSTVVGLTETEDGWLNTETGSEACVDVDDWPPLK